MGRYSREELEAAFANYNALRDRSSETGDWTIFPQAFTEDVHFIDHSFPEIHGREPFQEWLLKALAPFPHLRIVVDWYVIDVENEAVVFQGLQTLPPPHDKDGRPFQCPLWTRLVYGGDGLWKSKEDVYNPARNLPDMFKAWIEAGGKFLAPPIIEG
jgi:hypothetical protein